MISTRQSVRREGGVGFLPALLAAAPAAMSLMQKPPKTTVKQGNTIVGAPRPAPKSPLPWIIGGVGGVLLLSVGAWLIIRKRGRK